MTTKKSTQDVQLELSSKFSNLILIEEYTGANNKILIKCINCNYEWSAIPRSVIKSKCGCPKCGVGESRRNQALESFLKQVDNNLYEVIEFISPLRAIVKCKECGNIRDTTPSNIYRFGCKKCADKKTADSQRLTLNKFLSRSIEIHGNKYDYSKTNYISYHKPVIIICSKHGEFLQRPSKHLAGHNCPKCSESSGESLITKILNDNNIKHVSQKRIKLYKSIRVDFYLEINKKEYIIEYNGMQHYKSIDFFGGEEQFKEQVKRDICLKQYCVENKIELFIIRYDENIQEKMLMFLNSAVPIEESSELLQTNIGEGCDANTEINSECNNFESSYSIEIEPEISE